VSGVRGLLVVVALVWVAQSAWRWSLDHGWGRQLAELAAPGDLQMLASDTCVPCDGARRWLRRHGVAFTECSIERDPICRTRFEHLGSPGTPAFVVKGRQLVVGLDEDKLIAALRSSLR
jgi:glutaredoxin